VTYPSDDTKLANSLAEYTDAPLALTTTAYPSIRFIGRRPTSVSRLAVTVADGNQVRGASQSLPV
jgi:hypothetical protein